MLDQIITDLGDFGRYERERQLADLDARITAFLNKASLRPYPPTDDFGGGRSRWQFWSLDGAHFLGNESKFPVLPLTTDLNAVYRWVEIELRTYVLDTTYDGVAASASGEWWPKGLTRAEEHTVKLQGAALTLPCAIVAAVLKAKYGGDGEAA